MTLTETALPDIADFSDQIGIFDPSTFADTVTLIGCGGIGASALPTLVTMGFRRFVLWDPDEVEPRNVASQLLFAPEEVYRPKVEAAADYLTRYGAEEVIVHRELFTQESPLDTGVVISGVDTMAARQKIWEAVKASSNAELYLDGRIGSEILQLFAVDPLDGDWYENRWLFDDNQAAPLPCTERAIAYPAVVLGGFMARHLAHWSRGEVLPKRITLSMSDFFFQKID